MNDGDGRGRFSIRNALARCVTLRCPVCGLSSIVKRPFSIKHYCSSCEALFKREDGFYVGAMLINLIATELVLLVVYLACLVVMQSNYDMMLVVIFTLAVIFPIAFYHHSWSLWLSFDHILESLPRSTKRNREN